jgi:hypothetical protein
MLEKPAPSKVFGGYLSKGKYLHTLFLLALFVLMSYLCVYVMYMTQLFESAVRMNSIIFLVVAIVLQIFALAHFFNQYPTIMLHDDGITISFNFRRILIEWHQITDVRGFKTFRGYHLYVCSNQLPVWYYSYGMETFLYKKAFIIDPTMPQEDIEEILAQIRRKSPKARISIVM